MNNIIHIKGSDRDLKKQFQIVPYISPLDNNLKIDAEETLGSVLPRIVSSHSPLFVFTEKGEFIGLISSYTALYKHRYPYTTKVSSIAINPPLITKKTQLYNVASYMLENRMYVLPVFNEDKQVIGVISSKYIFQNLLKDQDLLMYISSTIKPHIPVTASNNSTVGDIFQIMKKKSVSRVILVGNHGILSGIVSRKDLLNAYMKPTDRQRFGKNGIQKTDRAFDIEKKYRSDDPIKNYATHRVYSLSNDTEQTEIIKQLMTSDHNSVVLTDNYKKPVGFLSMHDILAGFASLRPEERINFIMTNPTSNVSEYDVKKGKEHLARFGQKMSKKIAIDKIEITFEEPKTPTGGSTLFNTSLILSPIAGAKIIAKSQNRSFIKGIDSAIAQIEKQQRRSTLSNVDPQLISY